MNLCRFETQVGTLKVRFRTPSGPGAKVTLDISPRPRNWDERKGPGQSGAFLVPQGPGLATMKLTIEYNAEGLTERTRLRAEHDDFVAMVGSPGAGTPDKKFILNHPAAMAMSPPITECVFLNDPPLIHDEETGTDTIVFELKESRKQLPTLTSTTAPGGNTAEGQALDEQAQAVVNRGNDLKALATQAGFIGEGSGP